MRILIFLILNLVLLNAQKYNIYPNNVKQIKEICSNIEGGDIIYLREGIYNYIPNIKCSGNSKKFVKISAYPNEKVIIKDSVRINGNYLIISNLNLKGNSESLNYDEVISQWWNPSKEINKNGLIVEGHHIIIRNNTIGYFPASGLRVTNNSDYITIHHNIIYNNAWWATSGTGGIIVKNIYQLDNSTKRKIKITKNLIFSNESRIFSHVFSKGFSKLTIDEGESFLIQQDDDPRNTKAKFGNYNGRFLVKNNIILYNGKGSSLNKANNIDMIENFLYCNGTTASSINAGGIRGNNTNNDLFKNNLIEVCQDKIGFSVTGYNNYLLNNHIKSTTQKFLPGLIIESKLFENPKKLNFYNKISKNKANIILNSFHKMLTQNNIIIKPTNYKVDYKKQINDIIELIPQNANTKINKYPNKIEILNIDNKNINNLPNNFTLEF